MCVHCFVLVQDLAAQLAAESSRAAAALAAADTAAAAQAALQRELAAGQAAGRSIHTLQVRLTLHHDPYAAAVPVKVLLVWMCVC